MSLLQIFMSFSCIGRKGPPGCLCMHHNRMYHSKTDNFLNETRNYQLCKKDFNPCSSLMRCLCVWFHFRVATEKTESELLNKNKNKLCDLRHRSVPKLCVINTC